MSLFMYRIAENAERHVVYNETVQSYYERFKLREIRKSLEARRKFSIENVRSYSNCPFAAVINLDAVSSKASSFARRLM